MITTFGLFMGPGRPELIKGIPIPAREAANIKLPDILAMLMVCLMVNQFWMVVKVFGTDKFFINKRLTGSS